MNLLEENSYECPVCKNDFSEEIPAHHLMPGTLLKNRFYIGAAIGEGGFGITYIGKDTILGTKIAIKEYYPNSLVNRNNTVSPTVKTSSTEERKEFFEKGKLRFLNEAQTLAKFDNYPGIVTVKDFFEENNTAYIVMEYLEGITLKAYLKSNGNLSYDQTIDIMKPIMKSLDKIHNDGLIHRDISPDNIMIADNRVKLIDFGAARVFSRVENHSLSVLLKHGYAPEEQYRTRGNQGPWTDIYALCATIYKCITGITPDDANERVRNDELKAPSELGFNIPVNIEKALLKGLSVLQENRYQSISDLIKDLGIVNDVSENSIGISASKTKNTSTDNKGDSPTELLNQNTPQATPAVNEGSAPTELLSGDETSSDKKSNNKSRENKGKIIVLLAVIFVMVSVAIFAIVFKSNNENSGNENPNTSSSQVENTDIPDSSSDTSATHSLSPEWKINNATEIKDTDAKISGTVTFSTEANCTEAGFYIGTSESNLKKNEYPDIVNINSNYISLSFVMSKYHQLLKPDTTYYYKFYVIVDTEMYTSSINSFKTSSTASEPTSKSDIFESTITDDDLFENMSGFMEPTTKPTTAKPTTTKPTTTKPTTTKPTTTKPPKPEPEVSTSKDLNTINLSYSVINPPKANGQNAVIKATTSKRATKIDLFDDVNGNFYSGMSMKRIDDTSWYFNAEIFESGRHKITATAYFADGSTATDVIYLNYPFS
jgi:serine/threonine protein kinase